MKICVRCGNSNKDKATQCHYCKVDLIGEGTFITAPTPKNPKKLLSLLLLLPTVACLLAGIYFFLPYQTFVSMKIPDWYTGRDLELGFLLVIAAIACLVIMIVLLTRDPMRRTDDEADEEEEATYLMEMTTEEELAKQEAAEQASEEMLAQAEADPVAEETLQTEEAADVSEAVEAAETVAAETSDATEEPETAEVIPEPVPKKPAAVLHDHLEPQELYRTMDEGAHSLDAALKRSLLSAMAVSHLLIVRKHAEDDATAVAKALSRTFDTPVSVTSGKDTWANPSDLYIAVDPATNATLVSEFILGAYRASANREKAYFLTLTGLCAHQLPSVLREMVPFFQNSEKPCFLRQKCAFFGGFDSSVEIADNVWIVAVIDETEDVQIPTELEGLYAEIPLLIDLTEAGSDGEAPDVEAVPSVSLLRRMAVTADDEYGFSEELWKKLDLLEELLHKEIGFSFHNKLVRKMERFSGFYLASGGTEAEALDSMLAVGLIPMIAGDLKEYAKRVDEVEEPLHHFLDRVFGIDHLPMTADTLRVLGIA